MDACKHASEVLDQGNTALRAAEGAATSQRAAPADGGGAFWDVSAKGWRELLALQAERGPGPYAGPSLKGPGARQTSKAKRVVRDWDSEEDDEVEVGEPIKRRGKKKSNTGAAVTVKYVAANAFPRDVQRKLSALLELICGQSGAVALVRRNLLSSGICISLTPATFMYLGQCLGGRRGRQGDGDLGAHQGACPDAQCYAFTDAAGLIDI